MIRLPSLHSISRYSVFAPSRRESRRYKAERFAEMRGFAVPKSPNAGLPRHSSRSMLKRRQRAALTNKTRLSRSTARIPDVSESRMLMDGESFIGFQEWRFAPELPRFGHAGSSDRMACSSSQALPTSSQFPLHAFALSP